MNTVIFENKHYSLTTDESILSCFLRHGIEYPNSCQVGICQSCLIKVIDGVIDPSWQVGLPEILKAQGYFLACMAKPATDIKLISPDTSECDVEAKIIDIERLNYNVLKLRLQVDNYSEWIAGQYLNLINSNQIV
ncbi:MAG: 2Fe-2S iron-sulfur cluster binding domain-containing protein, partial [Legionella longbeachae]|nr:2Fe-2S iron-sulfur cluster binding domain-containing protein [Legionella longbeachae]